MVNQIGRQCYHCKSFASIFQRKANGKEYLKCSNCGKPFIYYPSSPLLVSQKRQKAVAQIAKEKTHGTGNQLPENPDVSTG